MSHKKPILLPRPSLQRSVLATAISLALLAQAEAATINVGSTQGDGGNACTLFDAITSANTDL